MLSNKLLYSAWQYFKYLRKTKTKLSVHSDFVFDFLKHVVDGVRKSDDYRKVEIKRNELFQQRGSISVIDYGTNRVISNDRKICNIARNSLKKPKAAQLLYRLVRHYQPNTLIEIGTSFGITTSYLALSVPNSQIHTFEGCPNTLNIAHKVFLDLKLNDIQTYEGEFSETLKKSLNSIEKVDFLFIDGNHKFEPTISYFEHFLTKFHKDTIIVIDDIYWSKEMTLAWEKLKNHSVIKLSIDLFYFGILFLKPGPIKQDFVFRFK